MNERYIDNNIFLSRISILNHNANKYICPLCATFCTSSKYIFESHLKINHSEFDKIVCICCSAVLECSKYCNHFELHCQMDLMFHNICSLCNQYIKMDCQESILEHLLFFHNNVLRCPLCLIQFEKDVDLTKHINSNFITIYHCNLENCFTMSTNLSEMEVHGIITHNSDLLDEIVFNCLPKINEKIFEFDQNLNYKQHLSSIIGNNDDLLNQKYLYMRKLKCRNKLFEETIKSNEDLYKTLKENIFKIKECNVEIFSDGLQMFFVCSICKYMTKKCHIIKRHILINHCDIPHAHIKLCLSMIYLNNRKCNVNLENLKMGRFNNEIIEISDSDQSIVENTEHETESLIHFKFLENIYDQLFNMIPEKLRIDTRIKIRKIYRYPIRIVIDQKRNFCCTKCEFIGPTIIIAIFHVLRNHLHIHQSMKEYCLRFIGSKLPTSQIFNESNQLYNNFLGKINLNYSENILKILCELNGTISRYNYLEKRMKFYKSCYVLTSICDNISYYLCSKCNYNSDNLSALSNHILFSHTGFSSRYLEMVILCTKLDSNNKLMSDEEMVKLKWKGKSIKSLISRYIFIDLT